MIMPQSLTNADVKALDRIAAIRPVFSATDDAQNEVKRLSDFIQGEVYSAKIAGLMPGGQTRVMLNGQPFMLNIPQQFKPGDTLMLKFFTDEAGAGFKLMDSSGSQATTASAAGLTSAGSAANADVRINISSAGREVTRLVQEATQQGRAQVYQAVIPATLNPLDVTQFAADLRHAIENSGLFYESHLADYVEGTRTLGSLRQEPQNQDSTTPAQLLAQQLNVLETQHVRWNGEVWPGQLASWSIRTDERTAGHDGQEPAAAFTTSLTLELPSLGRVSCQLNLAGNQLRVSVLSDVAETANKLQSNTSALVHALEQHVADVDAVFVLNGVDQPAGSQGG